MKQIWQNAFERLVNENQHKEQFAYYDEDMAKTSITRLEFFNLASRCASILRASGVKRGDVVIVALPLCPESAVVNYGAMFAGASVFHSELVPENSSAFLELLNRSTAKFIVMRPESFDKTWSEFKDKVGSPKPGTVASTFSDPRLPNVKKTILAQRGGENDFLNLVKNHGGCYVDYDVNENDTAAMFLTSGSTGVPKLVMRTHKSLVMDGVHGVFPEDIVPMASGKRFYLNAPWSWAVSSSFDILSGYTRVHPDLWHQPKDPYRMYANIIKTDGVGMMFMPPPELEAVQKLWDDPSRKMANAFLVAGFPVTQQICRWLLTAADKLVLRFGCSEIIPICCNVIVKEEDFQDFDCGALDQGILMKTVNDKDEELPRGTPGRILLKSECMFNGYMGQPDKTAEAIDANGWYVTTDAGYLDDRGHLFIIGRYDYVINHKGQTYYPSFLEKSIQNHPEVKEVLVVPIPDKINHHNIFAYVVRENGSKVTENDIIKFVADAAKRKDGAHVTCPQHILLVDSIARNSRGKINRNQMMEDAIKTVKGL